MSNLELALLPTIAWKSVAQAYPRDLDKVLVQSLGMHVGVSNKYPDELTESGFRWRTDAKVLSRSIVEGSL